MEEKKPGDIKFYKGLLIAFLIGLAVIIAILVYFWAFLKDYEECLAENIANETMQGYSGSDLYYYEDSDRTSELKRFRIQDGDKRLATLILEPEGEKTAFDHQRYRILYIENERNPENDVMKVVEVKAEEPVDEAVSVNEVSENTVSGDETVEEEVSLPITAEEEEAVKALAESYVKVYAPFSTIKEIGDLRSRVLALIKKDTNLYQRLASYTNSWGQNVNGYDFGETTVTNIKKTGDNTYKCDVTSEFITSSADWGVTRSYDLTYKMEMEDCEGNLLITSVE